MEIYLLIFTNFSAGDRLLVASSAQIPDVKAAPRGIRSHFPLKYTCDMAEGFRQMDAMSVAGQKTAQAFGKVFGDIPFASSTYSDNVYIWNNYREAVMEAASEGRCKSGEWVQLIRSHGRRAKGKDRA
jgi:hypothetical protein